MKFNDFVKKSVFECDQEFLNEENTSTLMNNLPKDEDMNAIKGWIVANRNKDPRQEMDKPEIFFLDLEEVDSIEERLYCWKFHLSCENTVKNVVPPLEFIKGATISLEKCNLPKILEIILAIGDFINYGSKLGDYFAIPLETVGKLRETKSTDNSSTLLRFLVSHCNEKDPKLIQWPDEILHLKAASEVSWEMVDTQLEELSSEMEKTLKMASAVKLSGSNDAFGKVKVYLNDHKKETDQILSTKKNTWEIWKEMAESYGTDVEKTKPEVFFKVIYGFAVDFKNEVNLINEEKEKEEEKQKKAVLDNKRQELEARKQAVLERKRAMEIRKDPKSGGDSSIEKKPEKAKKEVKNEKESEDILTNMLGSLVTGGGRLNKKGNRRYKKSD